MKVSTTIDTTNCNGFIRDLADTLKTSPEKILNPTASRLLSTAVRYTRKAKLKDAIQGARRRTTSDFATYGHGRTRKKGGGEVPPYISETKNGTWWVDRNADGQRTFYPMHHQARKRFSDARWDEFKQQDDRRKAERAAALPLAERKARESRGLAARQFYEVGLKLGLPVLAPNYVKGAQPSTGLTYDNAIARRGKEGGTAFIDVGSRMPILVGRIDGAGVLRRAMKATESAFRRDVASGVFSDAKRVAQRWPGFSIS